MFFYDNQLELDDSQLPVNHVSTIRFDQIDSSRAWLGCSNGEIHRFDVETLQTDRHFVHEQPVADLVSTENYLLCLSKTCVRLFDIRPSERYNAQSYDAQRSDDHRDSRSSSVNRRQRSKKRYFDGELKCSTIGDNSKSDHPTEGNHLVKLGSRSALSCLCEFDQHKYLLGGAQSELLLFDANQLKIVDKFPIHHSGSVSSCLKMKRIGTRDLIVIATLGGRMFIHDRRSLRPIMTFKSFDLCNFDFDVISENYILTTGSNSGYSKTEKIINVFDLRFNREMVWHDDSRFYRPSFVRALPKENSTGNYNVLTLDRNGAGELTSIENEASFTRNGKRFSIPLQANASICAYDIDSTGDVLLTADKNGHLHKSSLKAAHEKRPTYRLSSCPLLESNELSHTKHVRIDDIVVQASDGQPDSADELSSNETSQSDWSLQLNRSNDWSTVQSDELDIHEVRRNYSIKTHTLFSTRSLDFGSFDYQAVLADITQTIEFNPENVNHSGNFNLIHELN